MDRYFTKTFTKFLFGFLTIIAIAFGVIIVSAPYFPEPVDNVALPR
jgi:hypothetical protein